MMLHLVCDTSGSMSDNGKHLIARGVARVAEQYCRLGYGFADLKLVAWGNEARVIEWLADEEFPVEMLVCEKTANAKALIALLGTQPDGKVLVVTDGLWVSEDKKALKRWIENLQQATIRIVNIGADANPRIKDVIQDVDVFAAEDVLAAFDGWLEGRVT